LGVSHLEALLRAAPQLLLLEADAHCNTADDAHRLLREPPFGPLRMRCFTVVAKHGDVLALAADVAAHIWLTGLRLDNANLLDPAALDALVDAALARRLSSLQLHWCGLSPASVPALVRLLAGNALAELTIGNHGVQLLDEPAAALLSDALRANTSLTALQLMLVGLWRRPAAAAVLMAAMTGHSRLRTIDLSHNPELGVLHSSADCPSATLGALVAANAPALEHLDVSNCGLGDAGLGPLVDALRHNTHLRSLDISHNEMSEEFARGRLLPAVRANSALRTLTVEWHPAYGRGPRTPESAHEAAALVASRAQ
jgi:hypothetical protein